MKNADTMAKIGSWSFILGVVISVLAGVVISPVPGWLVLALGVLGLIVGFLNITSRESTPFLVAAIALVVSSSGFSSVLSTLPVGAVVTAVRTMLGNIAIFVAPAAVLVALRAIYSLASSE